MAGEPHTSEPGGCLSSTAPTVMSQATASAASAAAATAKTAPVGSEPIELYESLRENFLKARALQDAKSQILLLLLLLLLLVLLLVFMLLLLQLSVFIPWRREYSVASVACCRRRLPLAAGRLASADSGVFAAAAGATAGTRAAASPLWVFERPDRLLTAAERLLPCGSSGRPPNQQIRDFKGARCQYGLGSWLQCGDSVMSVSWCVDSCVSTQTLR